MNLVRVWLSAAAALAAGACAALPAAPPRSEAVRALETEHLAPADRFLIIDGARVRVLE